MSYERADGGAFVIHYFHLSDHGEELHCYPWHGSGMILAWGYSDEVRRDVAPPGCHVTHYIEVRRFPFGTRTSITPDTFHQTRLLRPD